MGGKEIERRFQDAPARILAPRLGALTATSSGLNVDYRYPEQCCAEGITISR
jgi:hypothetical protein